MGYRGMSKIARNISSRDNYSTTEFSDSEAEKVDEKQELPVINTTSTKQKDTSMANPFIGDNYFKENPSKILGEQVIVKGNYGSDIIKVKGDLSNIEKIDSVPVAVADFYPESVGADASKQDLLNTFVEKELAKQTEEKFEVIKKRRTANKANLTAQTVADAINNQEVYSFREVGEMYNKNISRDELEAYYFTNPKMNHKLLFDSYINKKSDLISKGLICYDGGVWVYYFSYISGNINKKISNLQKFKEETLEAIGELQYDRQMEMLMAVKPKPMGFVGDNKIILLPHSNFAKEIKISELRGQPELNGLVSLFDAFKSWLRYIPIDRFEKSNSREVIDYYLDNRPIDALDNKGKKTSRNDLMSKEEKQKEEKRAINLRQRTKSEGDALFASFLAEELLPEDQAKISYLWNEKFNSIVEPDLTKIPVCFQISKTFKAGAPLRLNPTQRQGVAFQTEKLSGLFAYGVGVGKGHLLTSDILTPSGYRKMGDIKIGDEVIGSDGNGTKVTGVFPLGKIKCYEVIFSDGSRTQVSKDHLWRVQKIKNRDNKNGLWHTIETQHLVEHGLYTNRGDYYYSIPMVSPINFEEKEIPIHPYVLGCLIGDGSLSSAHIRISNPEPDIIERVKKLIPTSTKLVCRDLINLEWAITRVAPSGENEVHTAIKKMGLNVKSNEKFIPKEYLFNSVENRLELLRGLLDTDGYINDTPSKKKSGKKGCNVSYTTVSEQLANDIKFLVQSFGGTVSIRTKTPHYTHNGEYRTGQLAYIISICLPQSIVPVSSVKQLSKFKPKTKYAPVRFIAEINEIGDHEAQCISVAAEDHLYVCEECIVTHNTITSICSFAQAYYNGLANKALFVVPTNTYDKWIGDIQGYVDKETGKFMQGIMPQLPKVVGLFNLNPDVVKENLKIYSAEDEAILLSIMNVIEILKSSPEELTQKKYLEIQSIYPINFDGLKREYNGLLADSATNKTFHEFIIQYLRSEYNYNVYSLGSMKSFPDGQIFVITEVGLQRLGVGEDNKQALTERLFTILSQGEKTADAKGERDVAGLQIRIQQMVSSTMKNAKISLEELGINWACFDEAHYYKKLFTFVKGDIKNKEDAEKNDSKYRRDKAKYELKSGAYPSARALSAFLVSHYVQFTNGNRNVIQLTATPFTNSPLEVYSMLTLTNYAQLEELGLDNMTDFFDTFMKINYDIKYTPQKTVVKDVVLTGYNNLPQLRSIIYSLMDKKDEGANLIRPNKIIYPSIEKGIETTIPMTGEQEELMANVKAYINGEGDYSAICQSALMDEIDSLDFDGVEDEVLIAEWERSTDKEYTGEREDLSDSKREELIKTIKKTRAKGVELDEEDLEDEEGLGVRILRGLSMMRQITLSPYLYRKACSKAINGVMEMPNYLDYVRSSPKFSYVMGCVKSVIDYHKERNEKISGQVIYMNAGVEYFPLLKQYLISEIGLKESQVGIVSGKMSKSAKETVKRQFLSGDILVLIGSSTISVGVDLQNNSTVLYNCYYDWNPTDAAQIEGRIWRQGNRFANVRIVYPQCYNSADPIIFEYLNQKTLRINEIWNRSSEVMELDLRDFNPKELQKKLITDPEEKAEWEILEQIDKIETQIIYFENRSQMLIDAMNSFRAVRKGKGEIISLLNKLSNKKAEAAKNKAVSAYKEKINEIVEKYSDDPNPAKMQDEIFKFKEKRYDHVSDPENKYVGVDYTIKEGEDVDAKDALIYSDALKYRTMLESLNYKNVDDWGDVVRERYDYIAELNSYRSNYKDMKMAEDKILKPLGLTFDTALNPVTDFNNKLDELKEQLELVKDSKPTRVKEIAAEMALHFKDIKTVEQRVAEFALDNPKYLSSYLIMPTEADKIEGAIEASQVTTKTPMQELMSLDAPLPAVEETQVSKKDMATHELVAPTNNLVVYGKHPDDKTFKAMDVSSGNVRQVSNLLYASLIKPEKISEAKAMIDDFHKQDPTWDYQLRETGTNKKWYSVKGNPDYVEPQPEIVVTEPEVVETEQAASAIIDEPVIEVPEVVEPEIVAVQEAQDIETKLEEKEEQVDELSVQVIKNQINALTLALKYAENAKERREIKEQITGLKSTLKYI